MTAHSTVRSLSSRYSGPLYQVKRADGRLLDISAIAGGFADAAAQDRFCAGALCYINRIYDQSGKGNDLMQAPPGPLYPGPDKGAFDAQPIADMAPITIGGGHKAYGVYIMPGMGFRNNNAPGPADRRRAGRHPVVVDGGHYSNGCCFNYGNASTNGLAVGTGTMESVYFGTSTGWGSGSGTGPWIMSDMEAGLFSGYNARVNEANPTITLAFRDRRVRRRRPQFLGAEGRQRAERRAADLLCRRASRLARRTAPITRCTRRAPSRWAMAATTAMARPAPSMRA